MVTGKSQPGVEPVQLPATSPDPTGSNSPPSKRDLASWWRQFKRNTRKDEVKEPPRGIFGVPLNVSIKYANVAISLTGEHGKSHIYGYVPIVVAKCGVFLKDRATDVEGIFRLNGSAKRIKDLQEIFDSPERYGKGLDWSGYTVHDAANVLRRYLNQLPEPIVPLEFYERFREPLRVYQRQAQDQGESAAAEKFDPAQAVETYQRLIVELPPLNKQLLLYILDLLAVFASKSDQNRMTSANLSAIFQPGMLSHPQHDMSPEEYKLSQDVLIFLIENQDHFLVGMSGTTPDEQQVKEVEAGLQPAPSSKEVEGGVVARPSPTSNIRRSVSNASGSNEGHRKIDSIRRNVSVSSRNSRNSRHSNNAPSPGTPTSTSGGGVHRSNTLPSKMGPVVTSARFARVGESGSANPSGLSVSHHSSRSGSQAPSLREESEQRQPGTATPGTPTRSTLVHTSTHGPIPVATAEKLNIVDRTVPQDNQQTQNPPQSPPPATLPPQSIQLQGLPNPASPPPQVVTPTRERKLANFFTKSPPPEGETRQPNRLRKKRIPGSASISAQSSTNSLDPHWDPSLEPTSQRRSFDGAVGDTTPKPPNTATLSNRDATPESTPTLGDSSSHPNTENSLRPHQSRTPSMNSRSSFTDHSDLEQPEDGSRSDRRENRRSWRFHRSAKRSSEQIGLGLASPPLIASDSGAEKSTTSFGSGSYQSNDPSSQPLSLDAGIQSNSIANAEPEKRSLFGKFKAKMAQVVKDDRERAKSPNQIDNDPSATSQPLSPPAPNQANGKPPLDVTVEQPKEEPLRSPASPLPGAGLPPAIPEEPNSPETPSAAAVEFKKQLEPESTSAAESTTVPAETTAVAEPSEVTPTDKETSA
ncbi:putative Rho GTPase activator (Sac7) [Penicillium brasilianum]|uniref:Putative Rho GTPase activator (Sac7) n=1 Tax=Penicillium brasilianum TaxID=104259 RepID=A0A1S9RKP6_PENBI|nr:putative Rho GTPase activator (Sac7) [Penicillium brasilianum]